MAPTTAQPIQCMCGHSASAHELIGAKPCRFCSCDRFADASGPPEPIIPEVASAIQILASNPAFERSSRDHLAELARHGRRRRFLQGHVLLAEGEMSDHLYLLVKGAVKIERAYGRPAPELVAELGPGDIVGEMGVLRGRPRSATVTALEDLHVIELTSGQLKDVFRHNHDVIMAFVRLVHDRLNGLPVSCC